jgi:hypothetical protein
MGLWLATNFAGHLMGGWVGTFWDVISKGEYFLLLAAIAVTTGIAIWILDRPFKSILKE